MTTHSNTKQEAPNFRTAPLRSASLRSAPLRYAQEAKRNWALLRGAIAITVVNVLISWYSPEVEAIGGLTFFGFVLLWLEWCYLNIHSLPTYNKQRFYIMKKYWRNFANN